MIYDAKKEIYQKFNQRFVNLEEKIDGNFQQSLSFPENFIKLKNEDDLKKFTAKMHNRYEKDLLVRTITKHLRKYLNFNNF